MDLLTGSVPLPDDWASPEPRSLGFEDLWNGVPIVSQDGKRAYCLMKRAPYQKDRMWWTAPDGKWSLVPQLTQDKATYQDWWNNYCRDEVWEVAQEPVEGAKPALR